ncbi:hypothetical protein ACOME3_003780 [Neoechinorhynchus agilis]
MHPWIWHLQGSFGMQIWVISAVHCRNEIAIYALCRRDEQVIRRPPAFVIEPYFGNQSSSSCTKTISLTGATILVPNFFASAEPRWMLMDTQEQKYTEI